MNFQERDFNTHELRIKKNDVQLDIPESGKTGLISVKNNDFIVKMLCKVTK
jgi:hypothetical protein